MSKPSVLFFGSFLQYSAKVLEILHSSDVVDVIGVVTTPPKPAGRKQELKKTEVHEFAESFGLSVYTPDKLDLTAYELINSLTRQPDLFVVAGYGKLLPKSWLSFPTIAPINIHFSLLPKYRGAMPAEWALLSGEVETGVSLIEMSEKLDTGAVFAQAMIPITNKDTRESVYEQLYPLGAQLFLHALSDYVEWKKSQLPPESKTLPPNNQHQITNFHISLPPLFQPTDSPTLYARLIDKSETYIPWEQITMGLSGRDIPLVDRPDLLKVDTDNSWPLVLEKAIRAVAGWPGVWTIVPTSKGDKRLKISSSDFVNGRLVLSKVQLEGGQITDYDKIKGTIVTS